MFWIVALANLALGGPMDLTPTQAAQAVVLLHAKAAGGGEVVGTGFLVQLPGTLYLVTAEHVARGLGTAPQLTYGGDADRATTVSLAEATGASAPKWVFHGQSDVAVLALRGKASVLATLSPRALQPPHLINTLQAPSRDRTVLTVGFPLGFGGLTLGPDQRISPLSRESHAASGLLTLERADTKSPAVFYLLDNPSIGGFSGAPVYMLSGVVVSQGGLGFTPPHSFCVGLVHGTIGDGTGGKLAAVVPISYVTETLEKAIKP